MVSVEARTLLILTVLGVGLGMSAGADAQVNFTFDVPDRVVTYDIASGSGDLSVPFSISEDAADPVFPLATHGFAMALAHDPVLLFPVAISQGADLMAISGGMGPDWFGPAIADSGDGVSAGVVFDLVGATTVEFATPLEMIVIDYVTVSDLLQGNGAGLTTELVFSDDLLFGGFNQVNVVVASGTSFAPTVFEDGIVELLPELVDVFIRGDSNGDGLVNVADAIFHLSALFLPGADQPACSDAADSNDDGGMNVADTVYLLSSLFVPGSPHPPPPHPGCGPDPTGDMLLGPSCPTSGACP